MVRCVVAVVVAWIYLDCCCGVYTDRVVDDRQISFQHLGGPCAVLCLVVYLLQCVRIENYGTRASVILVSLEL